MATELKPTRLSAMIADYPRWWRGLTTVGRVLPALAALGLWGSFYALGGSKGVTQDHVAIGIVILLLGYGGRIPRAILSFLTPLLLTAVVYDSQRYYSDLIRGPIHVSEPYHFDKRFFGITTAQGVLTPNEWWQLHTHWTLDLATGFYYLFFIAMFVIFSGWFRFWKTRHGTKKISAPLLSFEAPKIMWAFFITNVIGYTTYYWYAAAPPWYVADHGLGPADLTVQASPAGCIRFDQLLGVHAFTGFYGRSADVFGAIPSLHVSYPLIAVWYALRFGAGRTFALTFYMMMCFSAIYLNHHYVLDILWGSSYALIICAVLDRVWDKFRPRATPA